MIPRPVRRDMNPVRGDQYEDNLLECYFLDAILILI